MAKVLGERENANGADVMAKSAGILIRVSSDGQDEQNQLPELEAHCYERNYRINRRYEVHERSAYHGEHEAWLDDALADIRAGFIEVLVVVHSSRLDRRDPDVAEYYHLSIRAAGGRIESVREPGFGQTDISGRVITLLAQNSNHEYSKALAGHVQAAHNRIRRNRKSSGTGLFGRAPFGYEIQGEKYSKILIPAPLGLQYVPEMYGRVIGGESLAAVAAWLNSEGVPTGVARPQPRYGDQVPRWHAATVRAIIRNSVYKGQMRDSKGNFFGTCERIVSAETWRRATKKLDSAVTKRGPMNRAKLAMLSGVLWCECGSPMYRNRSETRVYYRCAGKVTGKSCFMIRLAVIDDAVNSIMTGNPRPVMASIRIPGENYDDDIDLIKAQVRSLDVDLPDYDEQHAALMAELRRLRDLDTTPDRWELRPTGETWGGCWAPLSPIERGRWLAEKGFRITASKDKAAGKVTVTVTLGEISYSISRDA